LTTDTDTGTDTGTDSALDDGVDAPPPSPGGETTDMELPFAWENGPEHPDLGDRDTVFRFPAADDPEPATRRLLGMSLYASLLGLVGLAVAVRGVVAIMAGSVPGWYEPTLAVAGGVCVGLVVGAFLSIHRRVLPWLLLVAAAAPLAANIVATTKAV
jgi:hypothetical protein